jgi:hypothetical protein
MWKKWMIVFLSSGIFALEAAPLDSESVLEDKKASVGGYGELHYNEKKPDGESTTKKLDFHRFVLFYGYVWNENLSFNSEVELEHNFVQGDEKGELELEQAYVDYHRSNNLSGLQAGVVLPSAGFLNEAHEPPTFFSVERPEYHKRIIPTTWFGNGVAFYNKTDSWDSKITIMEGFDPNKFSAKNAIRGGRQKGFESDAENLLFNARTRFVSLENFVIGGSLTWNDASAFNKDKVRVENAIFLQELHARYQKDKLTILAEIGGIDYDDPVELVNHAYGFYLDLGYDIGELLKMEGTLTPWIRYSDINTAADTEAGGTLEEKFHSTEYTFGLSYRPLPQVVFKADYGIETVELKDVETKKFNLGMGYMF